MIKFSFTDKDTDEYKSWFSFYPSRNKGTGFDLTYQSNGYFDPRPKVSSSITTLLALLLPFISFWLIPISLVFCFYSWGNLYVRLPFDTGRGNTAENKTYGLMFYHPDSGFPSEIWVRGWKSFSFPWAFKFLKCEALMNEGWVKGNKGDYFGDADKWGDKIIYDTYDYKYVLESGEVQERLAKVHQIKRYWTSWFGLNVLVKHVIEIEFNFEIGERSGSWKGGCIGCSWVIEEGETSLEALKRMENIRKF